MLLNFSCAKTSNVFKLIWRSIIECNLPSNSLIWCDKTFKPFAFTWIQGLVENYIIMSKDALSRVIETKKCKPKYMYY